MLLRPPLIPASVAMLHDDVAHAARPGVADFSTVDWADKAAVVRWIRGRGSACGAKGSALRDMPFASLPPSIRGDLDVGLAVADVEPASLAKMSPSLLASPRIAIRAISADSDARRLFAPEVLQQLAQNLAPRQAATETLTQRAERPEPSHTHRPPRKPSPFSQADQ